MHWKLYLSFTSMNPGGGDGGAGCGGRVVIRSGEDVAGGAGGLHLAEDALPARIKGGSRRQRADEQEPSGGEQGAFCIRERELFQPGAHEEEQFSRALVQFRQQQGGLFTTAHGGRQ